MGAFPRQLDESLYSLTAQDSAFLKAQTGITDDEALKKHILQVQAEIYAVFPYVCILWFSFAKLKITRIPAYNELLRLGKERKGAIYLEMACCVGNDLRKAIADGFPAKQVIASDLQPGMHVNSPRRASPEEIVEFWKMGHTLFKSTPESFPVPFIAGDAFDPKFLAPSPVLPVSPNDPIPPLSTLTSLTPLVGRVSAIHASAFFHLFSEEKQLQLAKSLASLMLPEPGSIIFGEHVGMPEKGNLDDKEAHGVDMFCHSPESWKEMWETQVFKPGQVKVDAYLTDKLGEMFAGSKAYRLVWSVSRV
ncbi:hypothetical protein NM688_g4663 [Phlebia brevispora]|uniref:Uncharacterized protein n=1 Tax=Phlebia brevispora TaxID=194682 RepID=A0ACC1T2C2_9APHY|nr:hypothetical protein NM688_g4663 [Phlebia brevispora]